MSNKTQLKLLTENDILKLPFNKCDYRIHYGKNKMQFDDLRLPKKVGPFPVLVVIHGGC